MKPLPKYAVTPPPSAVTARARGGTARRGRASGGGVSCLERKRESMKARKKWFGVKTMYRWVASGRSRNVDGGFDGSVTLVEERVVVFQAPNPKVAIRMAEMEAREYVDDVYLNPYGQKVSFRYLHACDCFEILDRPANATEVFSAIVPVERSVPDRSICNRFLGSRSELRRPRRRFSNAGPLPDLTSERRKTGSGAA